MKYLAKFMQISLVILIIPQAIANDPKVCEKVYLIAASAISNRDKGVSKVDMKKVLPPLEKAPDSEPLRSMHEILDEVYDYEKVDQEVYSAYRAEICHRRLQGHSTPTAYTKSLPVLVKCGNENKKIECGMTAAGSKSKE